MGVKLAHAMGAHTVLFTTSASKVADGKRLGADEVVLSKEAGQMAAHANSFDLIIGTVSANHDLIPGQLTADSWGFPRASRCDSIPL